MKEGCVVVVNIPPLVSGNRKAVVIHVTFKLRNGFHKIHVRLVWELEKKFSGKDEFRYRVDGSKIRKDLLDPKAKNDTEYTLETFSSVYRKLSAKDVIFWYPVVDA